MPKFPTKRCSSTNDSVLQPRGSQTDRRQMPNTAPYTNPRTLRSVYGGAAAPGRVDSNAAGIIMSTRGRPSGQEQMPKTMDLGQEAAPPSRVWNSNKPKTPMAARSYYVYAKQPAPGKAPSSRKANRPPKQWVNPPYPVHRVKPQEKVRSDRGRNYETFYVPFEETAAVTAPGPKRNAQGFFVPMAGQERQPPPPPPARRQEMCEEMDIDPMPMDQEAEAIRHQRYLKRCTKRKEAGSGRGKDQPKHQMLYREFQKLRPAGERYVLKLQTAQEIDQMATLIAAVKKHMLDNEEPLSVEDVPPLPPPPQFAQDGPQEEEAEEEEEQPKRPKLVRSKTCTVFSTFDCDEVLYEYACQLPFVRDPSNPNAVRPKARPGPGSRF